MNKETQLNWMTVNLLSEAVPAFSPAAIRNLIWKSKDRGEIGTPNGLEPHIRRIGAKVLINHQGFLNWIDNMPTTYTEGKR